MTKINEALSILKTRGWVQGGKPGCWNRGTCMYLALCRAWDGENEEGHINDVMAVSTVCREQYPEITEHGNDDENPHRDIWIVNDTPGRTFDEIERIMEKAYLAQMGQ